MPLMISADGKGWVKAPPKKRVVRVSRADQAAALKNPLAYFACTPVGPSKPKIPDCPVYTLDPNQHTPPTSEEGNPKKSRKGRSQGRSTSSPTHHHHHQHRHPYDDEYPPSEEDEYHTTAGGGASETASCTRGAAGTSPCSKRRIPKTKGSDGRTRNRTYLLDWAEQQAPRTTAIGRLGYRS
ncbi:uncharacterized protein HMPREF1541_07478 [Cyphellophora europaea CBS 101466]|uniref:Uncharacterized protein n=1 Tax=Cyphellophora europaea (strain CBS 101466) TaxID=1220924 RepID=W2RNF2_CYPE1|nr:uncharacterized protein HMPREF1541_07478 [Cyphellophora europaea CBS 101466]ETN37855.1 hypothetical protein HMPREF1541_07478 [Cyphellophora europaea CBS 101466]